MLKNPIDAIRSMIGGAGVALAQHRALFSGKKMNIALVNESTKTALLVFLAVPLAIIALVAFVAFYNVHRLEQRIQNTVPQSQSFEYKTPVLESRDVIAAPAPQNPEAQPAD